MCERCAPHASGAQRLANVDVRDGGPDRDRTGDLMNAIHARSQLRYWPTWLGLAGRTNLDRNALSRQRQTWPGSFGGRVDRSDTVRLKPDTTGIRTARIRSPRPA